MLSRQWMGLFGLVILWLNTLLIVAAALQDGRRWWWLRRRLSDLVAGELLSGSGEAGELAARLIRQIGRRATSGRGRVIVFSEEASRDRISDGLIRLDGSTLRLRPLPDARLWLERSALQEAAACPDPATFESAWGGAAAAHGMRRLVCCPVQPGARIFVAGGETPWLIATLDPRRTARRALWRITGFVVAALAGAAAATALALQSPRFGALSTAGGLLCLVFFLVVQPLAVAVHDRGLPPDEAQLRGEWRAD